MKPKHILFDWGNTLMEDLPGMSGPMKDWPQVACVPGAMETLAALSAQWPCHIATNANESGADDIRQALERASLDRYISEVFCYRNLGMKKPDTGFFLAIADRLQTSPSDVLMVGDSLENDVLGAQAAGLDAIWLNRSALPCPPDITAIASLHDLLDLLSQNG